MSTPSVNNRENFSGKFAIIAAASGSAIGLGNIWRFPYIAGENGGGAFLLVYLFFVIAIGIPVMTSEFVIGRTSGKNPYGAFKYLAPGKPWFLIGVMGVAAAYMILAFYTAVAGWTLEYMYQAVAGKLVDKSDTQLSELFTDFLTGSVRPVIWFLVFMGFTAWIVISGIKNGIEKYSKILMPFLLLLLIILCIRSLTLKGSADGLKFLFHPDISKITPKVILQALGQSFFSLSIGMGTLITYGSYIRKNENLLFSSFSVCIADTLIAIIAGIAIFPAVFALGGSPASGTGLVFIVLPGIFQKIPMGNVFAFIFFLLLAVAALTSTISLLEVIVANMVEESGISRKKATLYGTGAVSILGLLTVLSHGPLTNIRLMGKNIFELLEYLTSNIMLPLGGLCIVFFIGWYYNKQSTACELTNNGQVNTRYIPFYMFLVRFLAPVAIAFVFLYGLGIIKF